MVYRKVAGLLGEILQRDAQEIRPSMPLGRQPGVEPVDVAKLAIACEDAFGFALYDEKIAACQTLGDLCTHIERLLEEGLAESTERSDADRTNWYYA